MLLTPEALIENELTRLGVFYRAQGENFVIPCPYHNSRRPKLSIHKSGKMARCWSCDWTGTWNKLAHDIGARGIKLEDIDEFALVLGELEEAMGEHDDPWGMKIIPNSAQQAYDKEWRGISADFMLKLDARYWYDDKASSNRVLLPVVNAQHKCAGWVAARIDPEDESVQPKYLNMKDMPIRDLLYPLHLFDSETVVLVEGPFDAINLTYHKIPALAIFGVENWTEHKIRILTSLRIKKVFIAMDGDEPGRKAAKKIAASVEELFESYILDIPDDTDPGTLSQEDLEWMRSVVLESAIQE